jgi:TonB family protein
LWRLLGVSLALHLVALVTMIGMRFTPTGERPLTAYQVSLVTLPPPVLRPSEPPVASSVEPPAVSLPNPPRETPAVEPPAPAKAAPAPVAPPPAPREVVSSGASRSKALVQDALRGIALPPDAPRLGDISPPQPAAPPRPTEAAQKEARKLVERLSVPQATPLHPPTKLLPVPPSVPQPPRTSQAERLEKALRSLPPAPQPRTPELTPAPAPETAKAVETAKVETKMRVQTPTRGSNEYLARVQVKISEQWIAPPVDLSGQPLQVVIRFRLHRSGAVSGVIVEQSSGNGYYDDAGQRAVQAAHPLPPFPAYMTEPHVDAHFMFTVGRQGG